VDPGEHEGADDYPAGAEGDQPRVGGVQAEDHPAGELTQDEQPRSGGDTGGTGRSVGGPERRRDLVRVATASLAAYQALRDEKLAALPGVQRLTSTIVMKRVVEDRPYPT
jgi:hypothetical protein